MADVASLYESACGQLLDQVLTLGPADLSRPVPATPEWTVHDVVAHLVSIVTGILEGDYPATWLVNIGKPEAIEDLNAWTQRMVDARRSASAAELAGEWRHGLARLMPLLRDEAARPPAAPAFADRVLITDLTAHHLDINGALGRDGGRDCAGVRIGTSFYLAGLPIWQPALPGLRIDTGDKTYTCGAGDSQAELRTSRFTLFRALSGRRSPGQVRAFDWTGDPEPYLGMFAPYGPRQAALDE